MCEVRRYGIINAIKVQNPSGFLGMRLLNRCVANRFCGLPYGIINTLKAEMPLLNLCKAREVVFSLGAATKVASILLFEKEVRRVEQGKLKTLAQNKKARHEYFIEESFEAGIELCGTEVKSVRNGRISLTDAYIDVKKGEAFVIGMHISPYEMGNIFNKDPLRTRKLLLHKREINRLIGLTNEKGYTLIPLSVYLKDSFVKVQVAVARGKKLYDKRDVAAKRDAQKHMERAMKEQARM